MTGKYLRKFSTSLAIRKEKAENQNYIEIFILFVSEWSRSTKQVAAHAGESVEQGELPSMAVGPQTCTATMGINGVVPQEDENHLPQDPARPLLGTSQKMLHPTTKTLAQPCLMMLSS